MKFENPYEKFDEMTAEQQTDVPAVEELSPEMQKWYRA